MPVFTPYVPPPKAPKLSKASVSKKNPNMRRRPLLDEDLTAYGDEIFEEYIQPTKMVYVGFHRLINNGTMHISKCRRFVIEYFPNIRTEIYDIEVDEGEPALTRQIDGFSFYYFKDVQPLMIYNPEKDTSFKIPTELATEKLEQLEDLKLIEERIIVLARQEELEKLKKEAEDAQLATNSVMGTDSEQYTDSNLQSENVSKEAQSENEEKVCVEASEEGKVEEPPTQTMGNRFTKIS